MGLAARWNYILHLNNAIYNVVKNMDSALHISLGCLMKMCH